MKTGLIGVLRQEARVCLCDPAQAVRVAIARGRRITTAQLSHRDGVGSRWECAGVFAASAQSSAREIPHAVAECHSVMGGLRPLCNVCFDEEFWAASVD